MQQTEISQSELRNRLYETFKSSGVENSLKAQLRIQLVRILKKKSLTPDVTSETSLVNRAINSLFVDYLQHANLQYTLSVFLPESGMANQVLSRIDILNVLHLEGDSKLLQNMRDATEELQESNSLLLQLFQEIGKLHPKKIDKDMQTDTPPDSLDKKLRHLEDDFFMKSEAERSAPYRSLEERMLKYQRDCDERAKSEIQTETTRFKELELSRMRLEESAKFREMLNREREELEKRFNEKLEKLRQREQDSTDNLQKKEQDILKLDYDQRQKMMKDMEAIKGKENDLRREKEMFAKEMRMSQERFTEREEALNARLDEAHKIVDTMRTKFDADMELYKANYQKSLDEERQSVQRERNQLMDEMKRFEHDKEPHVKMFEKQWRMEDEAKINQQRLKISNDHCEHLNQKLKQMQEEVDRLTMLSSNLNVPRPMPIAVDTNEISRLKAMLAQEQEARQRAERECAKLRASHAEAKGGFEELQELHEQEMQDLIDDHKTALLHEKNKFSVLEQEVQRDKQRLKEELRTEVDIRNDLGRMLDEREVELSRLKLQFGLPPVPIPFVPGGPRPHAYMPPQDPYADPRFGMSQMPQYPPQPSKYDPMRPYPQDLPTNFQMPVQPKESDAWRMELNKTLNGILQLEKEDMRVQQKYYDVKSATSSRKKDSFLDELDSDEGSQHSFRQSKRKGEKSNGKGRKGGKDRLNSDSNANGDSEEEFRNSTRKSGKKSDTRKKSETDESDDEIDRKLREMEQREQEERERMEKEKKDREERHKRDKEELEKRERDLKEREEKMKEDTERQRQDDEKRRLEQELSVLRKMKEEEEDRRARDKREEEERREREKREQRDREREREEEENRRRQEDTRRRQAEMEREMTVEKERREREEKKAQELLSQIRDRREKEQQKKPTLDRPKSSRSTDSSLSDLDFGEVADILDGSDTFSV